MLPLNIGLPKTPHGLSIDRCHEPCPSVIPNTDQPRLQLISGGFWVFNRLVCRRYRLYSTNLVCLANERFWYWYGWNPYLHLSLGCDSWYARYVINLVK